MVKEMSPYVAIITPKTTGVRARYVETEKVFRPKINDNITAKTGVVDLRLKKKQNLLLKTIYESNKEDVPDKLVKGQGDHIQRNVGHGDVHGVKNRQSQ